MKSGGVFHEKGVDVELAIDILVGAYEDLYDTAIVISSDTDLVPAIKKAREKGKKIIYVGFGFKPSSALQSVSNETILLRKDDIEAHSFVELTPII